MDGSPTTLVRRGQLTILVVGHETAHGHRVTEAFEASGVGVVRAPSAVIACEQVPLLLPHAVVLLEALPMRERDELSDRTTAVGAPLVYFDEDLDDASLGALVASTSEAMAHQKLRREAEHATPSVPPASLPTAPPTSHVAGPSQAPGAVEIIDTGWEDA